MSDLRLASESLLRLDVADGTASLDIGDIDEADQISIGWLKEDAMECCFLTLRLVGSVEVNTSLAREAAAFLHRALGDYLIDTPWEGDNE